MTGYIKTILLGFIVFPLLIFADSQLKQARFYVKEQTLLIDMTATIDLPSAVVDAVENGIVLVFTYKFEISSDVWYRVLTPAKLKKQYRLSYNRLTEKYRIEEPVTYQHHYFGNLNAAKEFMSRLNGFPLLLLKQLPDKPLLKARFELSNENLPAFVKVERLFYKKWHANSPWKTWQIILR